MGGAMTEARVERRLAAILAADLVDYSRLMGIDEEGTLTALKAPGRELPNCRAPRPHSDDTQVIFGAAALSQSPWRLSCSWLSLRPLRLRTGRSRSRLLQRRTGKTTYGMRTLRLRVLPRDRLQRNSRAAHGRTMGSSMPERPCRRQSATRAPARTCCP
jgi:hypothetical protein